MDRNEAKLTAAKLGASYPVGTITEATLAVWAERFLPLDQFQGAEVLEFLQAKKRPPSVYEVNRAIVTIKNREQIARAEFKQRTLDAGVEVRTFGEWAADPRFPRAQVERLIKQVGPESYVGKRMQEGLDSRPEGDEAPMDIEPKEVCDKCGRPVSYGPNSQERYDPIEDKTIVAHIDCFKIETRPEPAAKPGDTMRDVY